MRELRAKIPKTLSVDEGLAALSYHGVVDESAPDMPRIGSTIFRDWFHENHQSITTIPADPTENKNLNSVPAVPHRSATAGVDSSLEIAHVLFMDLVSYSTMPMDEQRRLLAG